MASQIIENRERQDAMALAAGESLTSGCRPTRSSRPTATK